MCCAGLSGPRAAGAMGQVPLQPGTGRLCLLRPRPASPLSAPSLPFSSCTFWALSLPTSLPLCSSRVLQSSVHSATRTIFLGYRAEPRPARPFWVAAPAVISHWFLLHPALQPRGLTFRSRADGSASPHCMCSQVTTPWSTSSLLCVFKSYSSSSLGTVVPSTPSISCTEVGSLSPSTLSRPHSYTAYLLT